MVDYSRVLYRFRRRRLEDSACPHAAAVLCVRGHDPLLAACLEGLFQQDYPRYDVWVVVDSPHDPAWPLVHEIAQRMGATHVRIRALTQRLDTCSRKISGMLQAFSELQASHEIVAPVDSDTVPHRDWPARTAEPLTHPGVGVAAGNRWYMPDRPTLGALVRYLFNAAAVVQMYWYGIAWGGSLAVKTELLREADLREQLETRLWRGQHHLPMCRGPIVSALRLCLH